MRYTMFSLDGSDDGIVSSKDLTMDYNMQEIRKMNTFDCFNVSLTSTVGCLHANVNGAVVFIRNSKMNAGMFVFGIIDHLDIELTNSKYLNSKYNDALDNLPSDIENQCSIIF